MARQDAKVQQDLSRGMNAVTNPYLIGQQQSISIVNLLLDVHGGLRTRDGTALQTVSPDLAPDIRPIIKLFDFILGATGGGGSGGEPGPGVSPTVAITSPVENQQFEEGNYDITVTATAIPAPGLSIASVTFLINGAPFAVDTAAPYVAAVSLGGYPAGSAITLGITAADNMGNTASAYVIVSVIAASPPPPGP